MIKNYLKTALRNLKRNKSYAVINVAGLAVGIAASLLIFLIIQFETSFDNFHKKKDNIYRIGSKFETQDGADYSDGVSFPVAEAVRVDFPQIKEVASIFRQGNQITIEQGNGQSKKLTEDNFYYAEPQFFKMFDFGWLKGSAESSLNDPHGAVLTQATAEKYFGDWQNAIGKTFTYANKTIYKVSGILQNAPANSDFPFAVIVPYSALKNTNVNSNLTDWVSTFGGAYTFVVLPPELTASRFSTQLINFAKKHKPAEYAKDGYAVQPLREIHFDDRFGNYNQKTFSHSLITALALIGLFLILIACVNFIILQRRKLLTGQRKLA